MKQHTLLHEWKKAWSVDDNVVLTKPPRMCVYEMFGRSHVELGLAEQMHMQLRSTSDKETQSRQKLKLQAKRRAVHDYKPGVKDANILFNPTPASLIIQQL